MANKLKIVVFLGTCRENRLGARVATFMKNQLLKGDGHEVEILDAEELNLPILKKPLFFYEDRSEAPEVLNVCHKKIVDADGFVFVSGEYNHSIPPGLANMVDHFPTSSFGYKPSAIVCYSPGIFGGIRAAMQLRCFLGEVGCLPVSNIFGIPKVHEAISPTGEPLDRHMESGATKLITQLDWMATAMRNHRQAVGIPK